eukprot:scaffold103640_cov28-Tisochrysis_lutea.AAC.3
MAKVYTSENALFVFQNSNTDAGMLIATGNDTNVRPPNNKRILRCCCASMGVAVGVEGIPIKIKARAEPVDSIGST